MVSWEQVRASRLGVRLEVSGVFGLLRDYLSVAKAVSFVVAIPFGLIFCLVAAGMANSRYFEWRVFMSPSEGLTYVTDTDAPQRNYFRKRTVSAISDPLRQELDRIKKMRKQTKSGTFRPPTFEQDATEIRSRLKELMTEARLRRIPKQFQKNYEPALHAIVDAYHSIKDLEDSFEQKTEDARKDLYTESIKKWNSAERKCKITHDFFTSDEWRDW